MCYALKSSILLFSVKYYYKIVGGAGLTRWTWFSYRWIIIYVGSNPTLSGTCLLYTNRIIDINNKEVGWAV